MTGRFSHVVALAIVALGINVVAAGAQFDDLLKKQQKKEVIVVPKVVQDDNLFDLVAGYIRTAPCPWEVREPRPGEKLSNYYAFCYGHPVGIDANIPSSSKLGSPFKTWSIFLVCNGAWLDGANAKTLAAIHERFKHFGDAIGRQNAAIWFWRRSPNWTEKTIANDMDVERCSSLCEKFRLLPSEGPHVLVTTTYPKEVKNFIVLKLNGLSPDSVSELLTKLSDQLLVKGLDQAALDSDAYWLGWEDAVSNVLRAIGSKIKEVKVSIKGGPLELEVKGSP